MNTQNSNLETSRTPFTDQRRRNILIAQMAIIMALAYVGFQFLRFDIVIGAGKTAFHFGNIFVMLGGILLGGLAGGFASAMGLTIADLTSGYATSAIPTFFIKWIMAAVVYLVAEKVFKLSQETDNRNILAKVIASTAVGAVYNVIFDTLFRYLYKVYILGVEQDLAAAVSKWASITTVVNGILAVIISTLLYMVLRPVFIKNDWYYAKHINEAK